MRLLSSGLRTYIGTYYGLAAPLGTIWVTQREQRKVRCHGISVRSVVAATPASEGHFYDEEAGSQSFTVSPLSPAPCWVNRRGIL